MLSWRDRRTLKGPHYHAVLGSLQNPHTLNAVTVGILHALRSVMCWLLAYPPEHILSWRLFLQVGGAFGDHQGQAQPCGAMSMAADNRESDNSEHQSGSGDQHSMCRQAAHDAAASPSIKVEATEGAGETGKPVQGT